MNDPGATDPPISACSRPPPCCVRARCRPSSCWRPARPGSPRATAARPPSTARRAPSTPGRACTPSSPASWRAPPTPAWPPRATPPRSLCGSPSRSRTSSPWAGLGLTASSRVLEGSVAAADSAVWRRLRGHGVVLAGHSHTHEFAAGGTTDQVGNPWAPDRIAGGSSGGSAAALAARMVPAAVGTDTAGSLRIPAALSGVCSIKPTYGRIPDDGCIPLSPTLDHPGPMARSVADASALLVALATEPGRRSRPGRRGAAPAPRATGRARSRGCAWPSPAARGRRRRGRRPRRPAGRPRGGRAARRPGRRARGARRTSPPEDSVTILSTRSGPTTPPMSSAATATGRASASSSISPRRSTTRAAYEAAQARRAEMTARWRSWFADHGVDLLLEPTVPIRRSPAATATTPATSAARATR